MTNRLVEAVVDEQNKARTFNDAATNRSSLNRCVDLFAIIGNRDTKFFSEFELAYQENADVATRILLWARDIRGGSGERQTFRNLLGYLEQHHEDVLLKLLPKIPEVGRWDDLLIFTNPRIRTAAFTLIESALKAGNGLCAKWMPRQSVGKKGRKRGLKGRQDAVELRKFLGSTPKAYRQLLASTTNVVETAMCSGKWDDIVYDHIPSLAAARYQKAFNKHDQVGYGKYKEGLASGENTIKAGAVYPYDVIKSLNEGDQKVSMAQWDALPNFLGDNKIIPMVDVSGSMSSWSYYGQRSGKVKTSVTPMDISVSLGLYCADKLSGNFHGMFLSFSSAPVIQKLVGNLVEKYHQIQRSEWGMSTNLEKAMNKILELAIKKEVGQKDMPDVLLVLSDMEFDACVWHEETLYESTQRNFAKAGYEMPKIVFWALNGRSGNQPVKFNERGTALVSGFSPAILKSILSANLETFTPEAVMLEAVMVDRYKVEGLAA